MSDETPHLFAHKFWPLEPCERDVEIHRLVRVEMRPQKEVADKYKLSPSRVCRIVADVAGRVTVGHLWDFAPPEEKYYAMVMKREQLELAQSLALETHREQAQPQTKLTRSETLDASGKVKSSRVTRSTQRVRPDPRWLDRYVALAEEVCDLKCEIADSRGEVHRSLNRMPDWKEDHDATFAVHYAEELELYAQRCRDAGREVPNMPPLDRTEIEEFARRARRADWKIQAVDCMPPKWRRLAKQIFYPSVDPDAPMPKDWGALEPTETPVKLRRKNPVAQQTPQQPAPAKNQNPYAKKSVPTYDPNEPWPPPPLPEGLSPMEKAIEYNKQVRWIPGEGYLHPPGSFWYEWAKSQRDGTPPPFPLVEGPPGGEGRTYADGSWLTPDLQYGGGSPGVKSVAQSEAERILKMREEGWQEVIVGLDGEPRPKEEVKKEEKVEIDPWTRKPKVK
jgi:hypothetical protein